METAQACLAEVQIQDHEASPEEENHAVIWPLCVGTYVCMYVRMYVCTYVCMYVCMYVQTESCPCTFINHVSMP